MRILMTTRGSSGHVTPLAPLGHACLRAGHEVLVAAQRRHRGNVERVGLPFAGFDDPPDHEWMPLMATFAQLSVGEAHERMVAEYFGRIDTAAALPGLRGIAADWRPDVIVRESWEFASALVAELHGIPHARVALGLASVEEETVRMVAPTLDVARARLGLPADPAGDRLHVAPYLTTVPEALEDPAVPASGPTQRFRHAVAAGGPPLGAWWPDGDDPLVYLTFGSVAAGAHLPYYPALYRMAIDALAPLPIRLLVTIGERRDLGELGPLPPNVHVEHWVPQDVVAPHAAAIVCHGGHGSTLGALAHALPLVVLPLFSGDQAVNARAVARSGVGIGLDGDLGARGVLDLPAEATIAGLAPALRRVLADGAYRAAARRIAGAMHALPPADAAVETLVGLAEGQRTRTRTERERPVAHG